MKDGNLKKYTNFGSELSKYFCMRDIFSRILDLGTLFSWNEEYQIDEIILACRLPV
jgi:hypothetical protein